MKIFNQLSPEFKGWYIGKVKTSSFYNYACHLFCWAYMYSVKLGREVNPKEVDAIFVKEGVYYGDMIDSAKAAKALGLKWLGKEYDISKAPDWYPTIKEVDFSIANGKQQHFVIREIVNGVPCIKDPYGGVARRINFYEDKTKNRDWSGGKFSYRKVKI